MQRQNEMDLAALDRKATWIFWTAVLAHAVLWTLLPGLLHHGYRPDVIEQLFIGREWVPASARHPALPAFLLEIVCLLTDRSFFAPFFVSQCCTLLTVWGVWRLGRILLHPMAALVPPLAMLLYWFFTIESTKYNQNIPYIAFWTLTIYFVYEALRTNRLGFWTAAGVVLGLALNSKYSAVLLAGSILLFFVVDGKARKSWKGIGPYLTTATAFFLFLPQILWMISKKDVIAPSYITDPFSFNFGKQLWMVADFAFCQCGSLILPVLVVGMVLRHPLKKRTDLSEEECWSRRFVGSMILYPFAAHLLVGFTHLRFMTVDYGAPLWPLLGIWLMLRFQSRWTSDRNSNVEEVSWSPWFKRFGISLVVAEIAFVSVFVVQDKVSPYLLGKPCRFHFPIEELGEASTEIWSRHAEGTCPYTSGEWWLAGNAAEAMRPSPSVHAIGGFGNMDALDMPTSWSTDNDFNQRGGLIFWDLKASKGRSPKTLLKHFPQAKILPPLTLSYETSAPVPPLKIGVAIVIPEEKKLR